MGPPPLWSVAGEGGFGSGLESSVGCGGRGWAPRPDPAREGGRGGVRTGPSSPAPLPTGPSPLLPRLGEEGASSFGLRLRTGERCSLRGRSERHKDLAGGGQFCSGLGACCHPFSLTSCVCIPAHTLSTSAPPPPPVSSHPGQRLLFWRWSQG